MTPDRAVTIDGLVNVRDIGGLPTRDGSVILPGRVIRGDNPRALTETGHAEFIGRIGATVVIDLRMSLEVEREGYVLADPAITVRNLAMTPQSGVNQAQIDAGMADNLVEDYLRQLDVNAAAVAAALQVIADPVNHPVYVHCTAGKDRTGIVIAMLLDILGVDHELIVADYHLTHDNMAPILERIRSAAVFQENGLAAAPMWIFDADADTMRGFLDEMTRRYGGAESWALGHGLTQEDVASLRESLLDR